MISEADLFSYEGLIVSLADKFSRSPVALDREDFIQAGWEEVLSQHEKYDPSKSSYSHWVYCIVRHRFVNLLKRKSSQILNWDMNETTPEIEITPDFHTDWEPFKSLAWKEDKSRLSPLARLITEILLDSTDTSFVINGGDSSRTIRGNLRRFLREQGYTQRQISKAFEELKSFLASR